METVPRGDTERIGGGSGGRGSGGGRMPGNLDDTDVAGVSFQNVSREALMRKLAREPKEEPVLYVPSRRKLMFSPKPRTVITAPDVSRCVLLKNCFSPAEESGNAWVKELEDDVKFECEQKYGKVLPLFLMK
jgi:RNA-binding protein 23/39